MRLRSICRKLKQQKTWKRKFKFKQGEMTIVDFIAAEQKQRMQDFFDRCMKVPIDGGIMIIDQNYN